MGNCMRHDSSMKWAGEDWGCLADGMKGDDYRDQTDVKIMKKNNKKIAEASQMDSFCSTTTATTSSSSKVGAATEVKIKITKKQLEELLGKVEYKQMSAQQVLAQLIRVSDGFETQLQRSWRPALHSIPEVN
ncbi:unnamed protein product [Malus baccata var. baccata]